MFTNDIYTHSMAHFFWHNKKLSIKTGKDGTGPPLFGHIGDEISKTGNKKQYTGLQRGTKLQFSSKLVVLNWVCPLLSFLNAFNQSLLLCVLERRAFHPDSQYLIKFHDFVDNNHRRGWSTVKWGAKLRPDRAWLYG
jgi:hypothetical protein